MAGTSLYILSYFLITIAKENTCKAWGFCHRLQPVKTQDPGFLFHNWWIKLTLGPSKWNFLGVRWFCRDSKDLRHNSYFKYTWKQLPRVNAILHESHSLVSILEEAFWRQHNRNSHSNQDVPVTENLFISLSDYTLLWGYWF